ncbi:MAG: outer membrane protein assembly factor BamD [Symploca sp. SIO2E6]|nr:outer membrane protein assembly factor BamD [Symploca sp. SIO2E6]
MSSEDQEKFRIQYQAGKAAFEGGEYRLSVQRLEAATALVNPNSRLGGEVQIWLVTAYKANGQTPEAITLCRRLGKHPALETRKQSKNLLYILEAPQLQRRSEWLTQIPDLAGLADSDPKARRGSSSFAIASRNPQVRSETEPVDPSEINFKDNQFIWVALLAIAVTIIGMIGFAW